MAVTPLRRFQRIVNYYHTWTQPKDFHCSKTQVSISNFDLKATLKPKY
jgi:hypothetical protein